MKRFRHLSLKHKQISIIVLTTSVALLLAGAGFVVSEAVRVRETLVHNLTTLASILGRNCTGALDFGSKAEAQDILAGLEDQSPIVSGWLYDKAGQLFAQYHRHRPPPPGYVPPAPPPGHVFADGFLTLSQPVVMKGETIGLLTLRASLEGVSGRVRRELFMLGVLLVVALTGALLVFARLQRIVYDPLLNLARTARDVAAQKNYAVRVPSIGTDEIGQLIDSFNEMLSQIQERDVALREAHDQLEQRVRERTRELAASLSTLHATLESTADGILVISAAGRVEDFNQRFARMWNLPAEAVAARDSDRILEYLAGQMASPESMMYALRLPGVDPDPALFEGIELRDGKCFEPYCQSQTLGQDARGRVWSFRDITERRRLVRELARVRDAALESSRLKSEFLANMSHEIRTPMNGVIGMTHLLLDTELAPPQRRHLETIRDCSESLLNIINDILDFSKIEAKKLAFETLDFNLREAVEDTLELLRDRAREKSLKLGVTIAPDVPLAVRGDPGRLRQILLNLVSNAVKFTRRGEVAVRLAREAETEVHTRFRFEVRDTGEGIAPEDQERLFQAFSQADGSTTRKHGGTGLGLAISKQLTEMMGGRIGVQSQPGQGSTFWFTVQLEKAAGLVPSTAAAGSPADAAAGSATVTPLRILLAEDNEVNRMVALDQLAKWGWSADIAVNGRAVLAACERSRYDVILMDCQMPEMDGYEATRCLRQREQAQGLPPATIIAMTAHAMAGDRGKCLAAGMDDYLSKPVREPELHRALLRCRPGPNPASVARNRPEAPTPTPASVSVSTLDVSPVDWTRLREVTRGDADRLRRLLDLYFAQTREALAAMASAMRSGNLPEVGRLAHKLAGSSATVGIVGLVPPLRTLEKLPATASPAEAHALWQEAMRLLDSLRVEDMLAGMQASRPGPTPPAASAPNPPS